MRPGISDLYRQQILPDVRGEILREPDVQIIGSDLEEIKQYFFEKHALKTIEEDAEQGASYEVEDYLKAIPAHERERGYAQDGDLRDFECQRVTVEIPLVPNEAINTVSNLSGNSYSISYSDSDFQWRRDRISTTIETIGYGFKRDEDQVAQEVEQALNRMRESIRFKNEAITNENRNLLGVIDQTIRGRLQKISENKEKLSALTSKISIPLKKKPVVGAKPIKLSEKPLVKRIKPKATLPEEYVLEESRVKDVISFLDNQAKNFESTPGAVKSLGEEDLRDLLLANLNTVFQGNATGETFSKNGKTDIYLKINKGNILICECKIWGGKSLYQKTIDQLRGYLTWRHNYGIVITFVKLKGFSKALTEAEQIIPSHESYIGGFKKLDETHFISNHKVDDEDKEVAIHHLFVSVRASPLLPLPSQV